MHSRFLRRSTVLRTSLVALALSLFTCHTATAQSEQDKFFFLTFRLTNGVVTLVKSEVKPGTLKPQRDSTRAVALRFVLEKAEDEGLWSRRIDDPSVQRLEYEDPDHPGEIQSKTVQLDDVEFIVDRMIRQAFATTPEARRLKMTARHFSFNVPGGRCERCEGAGALMVKMHFLPDVEVRCPACRGRRFTRETLAVRYHDHDISQVLELTIEEALALFKDIPAALSRLRVMSRGSPMRFETSSATCIRASVGWQCHIPTSSMASMSPP